MEHFSVRMAEARKRQGMTQEQLAQLLHVSRQTVSHWETGRAMPDLEMAQRIAEALDFHEYEVAQDAGRPVEGGRRRGRRIGWIVIGAALLAGLVCGLLLGVLRPKADTPPRAAAVITVTPEVEVAPFIVNEMFPSGGWDVGFNFSNISDVPFRPNYLVARYYAEEEIVAVVTITYEQLLPWMASDMLRKGETPLRWPFRSNQLYMTGMECIIYGADANGNDLSFSGSVRYQQPPQE